MQKLDKQRFLFAMEGPFGALNTRALDGLTQIIGFLEADEHITDPRHAAYMLATTYHETAGTFQPIAEYDRGAGRKYGLPDKQTGKIYYGRGYVQLTWRENYQAMSQVFGLDFVNEPDLVMRPEIAYQIMRHGMRKGSFTGVKLATYIYDDTTVHRCDYLNARKIINGLDYAEKIAGYAKIFEAALTAAAA